ncbi:MAG: transcription elongation factor GreA [Chloroflexi bacterium]|nr:transcription elongation factor GreA [Chloroflexota bacterium]
MTQAAVLLTSEGLAKLKAELQELRTKGRAEVARAIREAQELGMSQVDGQYEDAKNQQAFVEGRILEIEKLLERATVIDERAAHGSTVVRVGSSVTVETAAGKTLTFQIVGSAEANPAAGRISHESPVGQALLGRASGDVVTVTAPGGTSRMTVTAVA